MKRIMAYILASALILSCLLVLFVFLYTGFSKETDTTLKEKERDVLAQEKSTLDQLSLANQWQNAETEYLHFREKYLIKRDRFSEFRRFLGELIVANNLTHSGLKYQNRLSQDGKLLFVDFGFDVEGDYAQSKKLIWNLERLPHAAFLKQVSMRLDAQKRLKCGLDLEVIFEK